jgi:ectoine hydroxylase-related dioxygenase (phytanoyl-CoA dioxygenase family)
MREITDQQVEEYQADGVVVLRGLFSDWIEPLQRGVDANMAEPSWRERTYLPEDGSARFFQDLCNWQRIPQYRDFVMQSPAGAAAARLMRSKTARIFHDHVLVKEPGTSVVTPWHQDQPYYFVDGRQSVSFWLPLDPVARDISIEYVAGSHCWGKDFRPKRFNGENLYEGDHSEEAPDVEASRSQLDIRGWAMQPGDAVAFNFRTLHGAPANTSAHRRRVLSTRWVGDDARFARRGGTTSPPYPDLEFADGARFEGDDFPVVFSGR